MEKIAERVAACRKCDGLGYFYDGKVKAGQFGETKICICVEAFCRCGGRTPYQYFDAQMEAHWCPCRPYRQKLRQVQRLFAHSDVPKRYQWKFLDDFKEADPKGVKIRGAMDLKSVVRRRVETCQLGKAPRGVLLWGSPGNGKTMLSCILLNELMFQFTMPGKFLDLSLQYFEKLRNTYNEGSDRYGQSWNILETLSTIPCLVIDDFGVQRNTEWEQEMLYNLVDARYEHERLTMVTTNKPFEEIRELHGGRIYSRLLEMCEIIQVEASDYREHSNHQAGRSRNGVQG
ncbi:MAG: AAA family ATPase [Candidatus Latescibacteria bacterium]|nr:AAA family ATPase [Candidatus Latescibacterota bacterium]